MEGAIAFLGDSGLKVMVIGAGGREHALVSGLLRSTRVREVVCAPGNAGISAMARCLPVDLSDVAETAGIVQAEAPDLVVIGPEVPLSLGLVDELTQLGLRVFGPTQGAAKLETSKAFAKDFLRRHGIPTAAYALCTTLDEVREELRQFSVPVVVKASGLAAGKGVVICRTHLEALAAAGEMFSGAMLGFTETEVVLEEFLDGEELSFFALCDGVRAVPIAAARDHKRVGEGDTGPNTGGMGAYSTDRLMGEEMREWLTREVAQRVVDGMRSEGEPFRGVLFCGMMLVPVGDGTVQPMVLEFNTRWGDPETEVIVLRLKTPLLDVLEAAVDGIPEGFEVELKPGASACVVAASGGYPGKFEVGKVISGLDQVGKDALVFHAGTAFKDGEIVTTGGRVLAVAAESELGLEDALAKVYRALGKIQFEGMQYRRDIGAHALG